MARFDTCPECGAPVRRGRLACPECGSDAQTGWQGEDDIDYQSLDIPDGYGPEGGDSSAQPGEGARWWVWIAALLALAGMAALVLS